jgi:hypothetical protein
MTMQSFVRISDSVIGGDHWWIDNRVLNYLTPSECRLASANDSDPPAPRRSSTVTLRETVTCAAFDSERRQAATLSRRAEQSSTERWRSAVLNAHAAPFLKFLSPHEKKEAWVHASFALSNETQEIKPK